MAYIFRLLYRVFLFNDPFFNKQIVDIEKGILFMYDTWRYLKNHGNASDLQKSGNSDKKYTFQKFESSLNCHKIKSYTYRIDFKSGNKAGIH